MLVNQFFGLYLNRCGADVIIRISTVYGLLLSLPGLYLQHFKDMLTIKSLLLYARNKNLKQMVFLVELGQK